MDESNKNFLISIRERTCGYRYIPRTIKSTVTSLQTVANCARLCRTPVCVKRTSSFGADERRCKRGIIATCYYLFVGRLVTRVGQPILPPPGGRRGGGRARERRGLARGMVGRESISSGFVCANHIGWRLSGARSACKPLTHDKHQPITEEHPSSAHPPRARARDRHPIFVSPPG